MERKRGWSVSIQFMNTDISNHTGSCLDGHVPCSKGELDGSVNWDGSSNFSGDLDFHANHNVAPEIIVTNTENISSSYLYSNQSPDRLVGGMCRDVFSTILIWLDGLPHHTNMDDVNLPPESWKTTTTTKMTPEERQAMKGLVASSPGRGRRFYGKPEVQAAMEPREPTEGSEWLTEEAEGDGEGDGDGYYFFEEEEPEEEPKPKRSFFKKLLKLGSKVKSYLGRKKKESSADKDSEGRRRLTKKRLAKAGR